MARKHRHPKQQSGQSTHPKVLTTDRLGGRQKLPILSGDPNQPIGEGARRSPELDAFLTSLDEAFRRVNEAVTQKRVSDPLLQELLALPIQRTIRQAALDRWTSAKDHAAHLGPAFHSLVVRADEKLSQMSDLHATYISAAGEIVQQQIEEGERRVMLDILRAYDEALEELELQVLELEMVARQLQERQASLPPIHRRMEQSHDRLLAAHRASVNFVPEIESVLSTPHRLRSEHEDWIQRLPGLEALFGEIHENLRNLELAKSQRAGVIREIERLIQQMDTEVRRQIDAVLERIVHFTFVFEAAGISITELIHRSPKELEDRIRRCRATNWYATPNPPSLKDFSKAIDRFTSALGSLKQALDQTAIRPVPVATPPTTRIPGRPNLAPKLTDSAVVRPIAAEPVPMVSHPPAPPLSPPSIPNPTTISTPPAIIAKPERTPSSEVDEASEAQDVEELEGEEEAPEPPQPERFIVIHPRDMQNAAEFYRRLVLTVLDITVQNPNIRNKRFTTVWWGIIRPLFRPTMDLGRANHAFKELQHSDPPLIEMRKHGRFFYPAPTEAGRIRARQWHLLPDADILLLVKFNEEVTRYRRASYRSRQH